jgi:hypothetical protein
MLHVTCDQCGKELRPDNDDHYVVKIEVFAPRDPAMITEEDLDQDHMEAISQLIQDMEDNLVDPQELEPRQHHFRFDLCPECRSKFLRDPLGKEAAQKFDFSEN